MLSARHKVCSSNIFSFVVSNILFFIECYKELYTIGTVGTLTFSPKTGFQLRLLFEPSAQSSSSSSSHPFKCKVGKHLIHNTRTKVTLGADVKRFSNEIIIRLDTRAYARGTKKKGTGLARRKSKARLKAQFIESILFGFKIA